MTDRFDSIQAKIDGIERKLNGEPEQAPITNAERIERKRRGEIGRLMKAHVRDLTPIEGTDGALYPAGIYQDRLGTPRAMTAIMKQQAERKFRDNYGLEWQRLIEE